MLRCAPRILLLDETNKYVTVAMLWRIEYPYTDVERFILRLLSRTMKHADLKKKALADPETRTAYEGMEAEFSLLQQMLEARERAGLSQAEVAHRMGTKAPAVTRLESSLSNGKHSPSLATLRRYAHAVGCDLQVKLVKPSARARKAAPSSSGKLRRS